MDRDKVENGLRVKTTELGEITGMLIAAKYLAVRAAGITGVVQGYVAGHGGDVWWVKHDDSGDVGAYVFNEFEPA